MTDPDPRRFDDLEIDRILQRASELQEATPAAREMAGGLTAEELEEIAGEVGIESSLVRRAIHELDAPKPPLGMSEGFLGAPVAIQIERVVAGEVHNEAFVAIQKDIEAAAQCHGQGGLIGRSFQWQSGAQNPNRSLLVQVASHDGETRIFIEERLHKLAGGLFGGGLGGVGGGVGLGVGMGVGLGALGSPLFTLVFSAGVIGGSYLLARGLFTAIGRGRQRALARLAEQLEGYPAVED